MTEVAAQSNEQRPGTDELEVSRAASVLPSPFEVLSMAASELPKEERYRPEQLQAYIDGLREVARQDPFSVTGRTYSEAKRTASQLEALIIEHHPELVGELKPKEVTTCIAKSVLLAYRAAMRQGGHSRYATNRMEAFDEYYCYAFVTAALRDAAEIKMHKIADPAIKAQFNSARFLIDLVQDERYCEFSPYHRRQIIRKQACDPKGAIEQALGTFEELRALAEEQGVPLSRTNLAEAAVIGLSAQDVIRNTVQITEAIGTKDKILTPALVRQFCCSYKEPLPQLQTFYERAKGLLEAHESGAFPDLSERQLVRMAVVSPKNVDALLARTAANMNMLQQEFANSPGFTPAIMRQIAYAAEPYQAAQQYVTLLLHLQEIDRKANLQALTSTLRTLALGGNVLNEEELRHEVTLAKVREATLDLKVPLWVTRIMVNAYNRPTYSLREIEDAVTGAAELLERGVLQALILNRNEEAGNKKVDDKTCYYLAFSEGTSYSSDERKAIVHAFGRLDILFYGTDVSPELKQRYGTGWYDRLVVKALRTEESLGALASKVLQEDALKAIKTDLPTQRVLGSKPSSAPGEMVSTVKNIDIHDVDWLMSRLSSMPEDIVERNISHAKTIEIGMYAEKLLEGEVPLPPGIAAPYGLKNGRMSTELIEDLAEAVRQKDHALDEMNNLNLPLVVKFATQKRFMGRGLSEAERISEGTLGLMHAIKKFDYTKGYTLSTYAAPWINQAIGRAIADTGRMVRLPVHVEDERGAIFKTMRELNQTLERQPTADEIAEELDTTPERVEFLLRAGQHYASFSTPVTEDGSRTLGDFIEDDESEDAYDAILAEIDQGYILQYLQSVTADPEAYEPNRRLPSGGMSQKQYSNFRARFITPKEYGLLVAYYGLDGNAPVPIQEIAAQWQVSGSAVRSTKQELLERLRSILGHLDR